VDIKSIHGTEQAKLHDIPKLLKKKWSVILLLGTGSVTEHPHTLYFVFMSSGRAISSGDSDEWNCPGGLGADS
jgi:hypothetical protein